MEVLDYLFEQEKKHREAVSLERRMKSTVFPVKMHISNPGTLVPLCYTKKSFC